MPRPRKPVEQFELATGWPLKIYDRIGDVRADGFKLASVQRCVGRVCKHHKGFGWREADATSRLPELIDRLYVPNPHRDLSSRNVYLSVILSAAKEFGDPARIRELLVAKFGLRCDGEERELIKLRLRGAVLSDREKMWESLPTT